jgi:hypothetical protein
MSFLKKAFGKKPGGSMLGNALRGVASNYSGGTLGNRSGLTAWEIENGYRDADGNVTQSFKDFDRGEMSPEMAQLSEVAVNGALETPDAKNDVANVVLKKSLPWLLIAIIVGLALWLFKSNSSSKTEIKNVAN